VIRLLVVDDHPVVRQGLIALLEDDAEFRVVGAAGSAEEALPLARGQRPDVVLLDLELPGMEGVAAIPRLLEAAPEARVLVFTAYQTDERVLGALRAGARGYVLKGASADDLGRAIRTVAGGGSYLDPRVAATVVSEMRGPAAGHAREGLSGRERQVLRLVADGLANKQIARELAVSERTVKFHVASLFRKLGADNRAQAVALAVQRGLL
jgi:DNA-binding NarL/FixJ family response regulator